MNDTQLTISALLKRKFPAKTYGSVQTNAAILGIKPKQFGAWLSGVSKPNSDTTILLLKRMDMLKNVEESK